MKPWWIVLVGAAVVLAGCGSAEVRETAPRPEDQALPIGWRWESFAEVEVGVPGDWGYDNGSERAEQWCTFNGDAAMGVVGRPGPVTLVLCGHGREGRVNPRTLIRNGGMFLAFEQRPSSTAEGVQSEGDRTTVIRRGVAVIVQAK